MKSHGAKVPYNLPAEKLQGLSSCVSHRYSSQFKRVSCCSREITSWTKCIAVNQAQRPLCTSRCKQRTNISELSHSNDTLNLRITRYTKNNSAKVALNHDNLDLKHLSDLLTNTSLAIYQTQFIRMEMLAKEQKENDNPFNLI